MNAAQVELVELLEAYDIRGVVALQMGADPERALAVLKHAMRERGVLNPPAYAIARWKAGFDPRPSVTEAPSAPPPAEWFELGRRLGASVR